MSRLIYFSAFMVHLIWSKEPDLEESLLEDMSLVYFCNHCEFLMHRLYQFQLDKYFQWQSGNTLVGTDNFYMYFCHFAPYHVEVNMGDLLVPKEVFNFFLQLPANPRLPCNILEVFPCLDLFHYFNLLQVPEWLQINILYYLTTSPDEWLHILQFANDIMATNLAKFICLIKLKVPIDYRSYEFEHGTLTIRQYKNNVRSINKLGQKHMMKENHDYYFCPICRAYTMVLSINSYFDRKLSSRSNNVCDMKTDTGTNIGCNCWICHPLVQRILSKTDMFALPYALEYQDLDSQVPNTPDNYDNFFMPSRHYHLLDPWFSYNEDRQPLYDFTVVARTRSNYVEINIKNAICGGGKWIDGIRQPMSYNSMYGTAYIE